jgi:ABC-type lipoprotein export system ATPase subunit
MLTRLKIKNFTVFSDASFDFCGGINVIIGENGLGKSHLLKIGYVNAWCAYEFESQSNSSKAEQQKRVADKLVATFRPLSLGRLARRGAGRSRAEIASALKATSSGQLKYSFSTASKSDVALEAFRPSGIKAPVFFPTKEVISMFPKFASLYRDYHIEIDETYYDLCLALERPLLRGRRFEEVQSLLQPLGKLIRGTVSNDRGRFMLHIPGRGNMEMPLVAEGIRKLASVAYLVANGSLMNKSTLYWDEPETNLNPSLIAKLAEILIKLCAQGTQVILATHSLFLLKEIEIQLEASDLAIPGRFFALSRGDDGQVNVAAGDSLEEVEPIAALDAELEQSDRFNEIDA